MPIFKLSVGMCVRVCVTFVVFTDCESCTRPISANPGSMESGEYGLTRGTCFRGPTPQWVGWTVTGPSLAGRLHSLGFCWWVSSRKSHTIRRRSHLRGVISTAPNLSGSGRGLLAHAPGSSSVSCCCNRSVRLNRHPTCTLHMEVRELKLYFYPAA